MSFREFFYLQENPFGETPDTRFYFPARPHEEALRQISWALEVNKGFTLVTGDAGSGKTMLSRLLYHSMNEEARFAFILNPTISEEELLRTICREFNVPLPAGKPADLECLNQVLLDRVRKGLRNILVIDEAQCLSDTSLEFVRLLTNLETDKRKLLQVIFFAQNELEERLRQLQLRQLRQRVALHVQIPFLTLEDTAGYIRHRLERVGGGNFVRFDPAAVKRIHRISGGAPRMINKICELALRFAALERARLIDTKLLANLPLEQVGLRVSGSWLSFLHGGLGR
jgi:general secretion pathway protein A